MNNEAKKRLEKHTDNFDEIMCDILGECRNYKITKEIYFLETNETDKSLRCYVNWKPKPNEIKFKSKLYLLLTETKKKSEAIFKTIAKEEREEFINIFNINTEDLLKDITENEKKYFDVKDSLKEKPGFFAKRMDKLSAKEGYIIILKEIIGEVKDNMNNLYFESEAYLSRDGTAINPAVNKFKLKINISVSELAYFFKVLEQHKIIEISQKTELFRFISDNFQTKGAETISTKSIKNKFDNPENNTIKFWNDKFLHFRDFSQENS